MKVLTTSLWAGLLWASLGVTAQPSNEVPAATDSLASNLTVATTSPTAPKAPWNGDQGLRLNFHGVPLTMVLDYLSEAAGFIVVMESKVEGNVDVTSRQPVSKEEAVQLLDTVLAKNGYAAVRNGRTLTIVPRDEAKKRDLRVQVGSDPTAIPKTDEMVTQIIPVRYANAAQMTKDLQPLLPTHANLSANESANAFVLTDTQADIKRMVEIIHALDTSISAIATVRVFPLRFADAKDLASELKELFTTSSGSSGSSGQSGANNFPTMMMGRFSGPGGMGGPGGASTSTSAGSGQSEARQAASRVTAVADERTNSLIVSAPDATLTLITELIDKIDQAAENITALRVFHLHNADANETADLLTSFFSSDSSDNDRSTLQSAMGGFGPGGPGGFGPGSVTANTASSNRSRQKNRVVTIADGRTSSVIVAASSELMPHIEAVVNDLDANPAFKQKLFVFSLQNAQVDNVQQILSDLFQSQNSRSSTANNQNDPLQQRQQNQGYGSSGSTMSSSATSGLGGRRAGQ